MARRGLLRDGGDRRRPELGQQVVSLEQVAPGVYEAPMGTLKPGAYALRVLQKRAGVADLGRTLGLVAPAPAEYRLLGVNEALLTTLRSATGGRAIETPAEVWTTTCARPPLPPTSGRCCSSSPCSSSPSTWPSGGLDLAPRGGRRPCLVQRGCWAAGAPRGPRPSAGCWRPRSARRDRDRARRC